MLHFRSSQKIMGLEILKNQGKLPPKQVYGPKQCHFMGYFGAYALKGGKVRI
jgi:hypothetical protein